MRISKMDPQTPADKSNRKVITTRFTLDIIPVPPLIHELDFLLLLTSSIKRTLRTRKPTYNFRSRAMAPVILQMDVHCLGCARKIRKAIQNLDRASVFVASLLCFHLSFTSRSS
jgi:hypothetical protein